MSPFVDVVTELATEGTEMLHADEYDNRDSGISSKSGKRLLRYRA